MLLICTQRSTCAMLFRPAAHSFHAFVQHIERRTLNNGALLLDVMSVTVTCGISL